MKRSIREWKSYARQVLPGHFSILIVGMLAVFGVNFLGGTITSGLFRESSVYTLVLSRIFTFILALVLSIFSAGLSYMYLNIARGKAYSLGDLLFFFKSHPDRVIGASFVLVLISTLTALPCDYYIYTTDAGTTVEEQASWAAAYLTLFLLTSVLEIIFTFPFAMAFYLLADNPELSGLEALRESVRMMRGYKIKYLLMKVSFVPLMILSIFTLYIGLLWLMPYIQMSEVMLYRDLCGEFDLPRTAVLEEKGPAVQQRSEDDFNSEA